MRNWRVLTAIAAVVLAVIAGVLVWKYVDDADERAAEKKELVPALVARSAIARGTPGSRVVSENLYEVKLFARESLPEGRIPPGESKGRDEALTELLGNRIARDAIPKGVALVNEQFVQPSQVQGSFTGFIPEGKQAISITVDDQHGVGGFISPGDRINMLVSGDVKDLLDTDITPLKATAYLLPGIKVLAVGRTTELDNQQTTTPTTDANGNTTDAEAQPVQRGLITLEVDARQAEQIAHAYSLNLAVYLSLNPANFDPGSFQIPAEIVEAVNLFDQELTRLNEVQAQVRAATAANANG